MVWCGVCAHPLEHKLFCGCTILLLMCLNPGSNWGPFACEANVMTNYTIQAPQRTTHAPSRGIEPRSPAIRAHLTGTLTGGDNHHYTTTTPAWRTTPSALAENRTRVSTVAGWYSTTKPRVQDSPTVGLEPTTTRLQPLYPECCSMLRALRSTD